MTRVEPPTGIAVFDLDGTLTWNDTLRPFLTGYLRGRRAMRRLRVLRFVPALARFALDHDRGTLKSQAIRAVMGGDPRGAIDTWADRFVGGLHERGAFRSAALAELESHRASGHHLVLLSASPDLYVPRIGRLLGVDECICTEVNWHGERLSGTLRSANRRGEEKVRCLAELRSRLPGLPITAYGNSTSDLPHLARADRAMLVNATAGARRAAARAGIPTAEWR